MEQLQVSGRNTYKYKYNKHTVQALTKMPWIKKKIKIKI